MRLDAHYAQDKLGKRGLKKKEIDQWLQLHDRASFARQYLTDRNANPWEVRPYQRASLESYALRKVHCDGRDVGKTAEIETIAAWAMVACPDTEMLIATQCENHLFPLMSRLARRFEQTPEFAPSLVELRRSPSWFLRFANGFSIWGRIAGPRGVNFQGMHVAWQIVDEAQEMTETGWGELYQALNGGGRRWVYGVPNGLRNAFYRMTKMGDAEQYNWPSSLNPEFTREKDAELALLYGGRTASGYLHRVLGQHGAPAHAAFNLDDYLECVDPGVTAHNITLHEEDTFVPPCEVVQGDYYLGCDLGYARDPSELVVYQAVGPHFVNVLRVQLLGVNYAKQQDILCELDAAYDFRGVGIDCGNSGRAVAHNLMARGDLWCEKIRAYEFGSAITLDPLPDGTQVRRRTKQFMTELLQRRMAERSIVFPAIADRETQYASHTYTVSASGEIIYEKGDDHIIDADRCAVLRHYQDTTDFIEPIHLGIRLEGF